MNLTNETTNPTTRNTNNREETYNPSTWVSVEVFSRWTYFRLQEQRLDTNKPTDAPTLSNAELDNYIRESAKAGDRFAQFYSENTGLFPSQITNTPTNERRTA